MSRCFCVRVVVRSAVAEPPTGRPHRIQQHGRRYNSSRSRRSSNERMKVAIVGGGASGLSAALHLAPLASRGLISSPIDVFEASSQTKGRSIGVGIWSTALEPFRRSDRPSHQLVWDRMTSQGSWVGDVGYRTPRGTWLVTSRLPPTGPNIGDDPITPGLLFLKECDVQSALRMAVASEENHSLIRVHSNSPVTGIFEESPRSWSAPLLFENGRATDRDYHLIVAADGIHSKLRKAYGGHSSEEGSSDRVLTGASAFFDTGAANLEKTKLQNSWDAANQNQNILLEDRKYSVFRGNVATADLPAEAMAEGCNFQTWGEGKSMRFATVRMENPKDHNRREEKQVWFITIDDDDIVNEADPVKRKELLLAAFADWHAPICDMVAATPVESILMERATAHRHCVAPVCDMNEVLKRINGRRPPSSGNGPAMAFIGDAFMTVDPILAQGFSIGMEAAADLSKSIETSCHKYEGLLFDPYQLRSNLKELHERRLDRLVCLLRATEIVQALGQPRDGTLTGFVAKNILRPTMRVMPNFVKTPIFNAMLRYSLGMPLSGKR